MELVLLVCLAAAPLECQKVRLAAEAVTPVGCLAQGLAAGAEWIGEHPDFRVAGWRCGAPKSRARDLGRFRGDPETSGSLPQRAAR
jgi:hypothetical protein